MCLSVRLFALLLFVLGWGGGGGLSFDLGWGCFFVVVFFWGGRGWLFVLFFFFALTAVPISCLLPCS